MRLLLLLLLPLLLLPLLLLPLLLLLDGAFFVLLLLLACIALSVRCCSGVAAGKLRGDCCQELGQHQQQKQQQEECERGGRCS